MPTPLRNGDNRRAALSFGAGRAAVLSLGLILACASCKKTAPQASKTETQTSPAETQTSPPETKLSDSRETGSTEGNAAWYDVSPDSLTKRRAGKDELTAAHIHLPLGTKVRVTHLANGRSVIVRIIDRLVSKNGALIDLSKEAAEKLDMLSEGVARVRLEILPDDESGTAAPESKATAPEP